MSEDGSAVDSRCTAGCLDWVGRIIFRVFETMILELVNSTHRASRVVSALR